MTPQELHDLIFADSEAKAHADAGRDNDCAARCVAIAPPELRESRATELTVLGLYPNPQTAETVMDKIESAAVLNPVIARALKWMQPGAPGVDLSNTNLRAMLTQPLPNGCNLTAAEAAPLLALAERPATITSSDVSAAWAQYRPNGKVGG